ncbi:MAG TPA: lysylphosphatidylglycerol synthase transmembrane domain-containing protein [Nitrolancea sp.]|jgi:uncharacterized protein (TIRG00374 family)|nr:lysylphosphatidylglycerol synthase transmembrane domain-containing protein [Nitrolancea sp.]
MTPERRPDRSRLNLFKQLFGVLWIVILAVLVAVYVTMHWDELHELDAVIARTQPRWIVSAGVLEVLILFLTARTYQAILLRLGHQVPAYAIVSAYLRGLSAAAVIPFGGPVSVIIFTRALSRRNVPMNDAVYTSALMSLAGFASFLMLMLPLLVLLYLTDNLPAFFVAGTLALSVIFGGALGILALALKWGRAPGWIARRVPAYVGSFIRQARSHRLRPADLVTPLLLSICVDLCGAMMLYTALVSVGKRSGLLPAFAAYQVEMFFNVVTPLFQGFGLTDLSIAVVLNNLGIPVSTATTATLVYRFWDLWVPLLAGAALHLAHRHRLAHRSHSV